MSSIELAESCRPKITAQTVLSHLPSRLRTEGYSQQLLTDLYDTGIRFIPIIHLQAIGHLALEMDCCFKEEALGYRPSYTIVLLAPEEQIVNRHLLRYWRKHALIVTSAEDCALLQPLTRIKELRYEIDSYCMRDDGTAKAFSIYREWGDRSPLIRVTDEDRRRGWEWLEQKGVPSGAWFVCFHARESGGRQQDHAHLHRNVNINTYIPAMEEVVRRGGWCVRMGDPAMQKLPALPQVIDYASSSERADWLDVFLFGSCRFLVGCNSGPVCVAASFGIPTLVTNSIPLSTAGLLSNDLVIYKRLWSRDESRFLTFAEIMVSRFGQGNCFTQEYEKSNLEVIDNKPEEISAAVIEMIERLDGTVRYNDEDVRLQAAFKGMYKPGHYGYGAASRVGRDFLRGSVDLLGKAKTMTPSKIIIETTKAVAFDSPDHIQPWGTARDDSTNNAFNQKLQWWLPREFIRVLDIGCSGGGFVKSIIDQGGFAVGVEGSDYSKKIRRAQWATIPEKLFTTDATADFQLFEVDAEGTKNPLKFNIITAWEFIEHIREEDLPKVMKNVDRHLSPNGVVIMSVSPNEETINGVTLHLCVHDHPWWIKKFDDLGYTCHAKAVKFFGNDMVRWEANAPGSFHVILTRKGESLPFPARLSPFGMGYARGKDPLYLTKDIVRKGILGQQPVRVIDIGLKGAKDNRWDIYGQHLEYFGFTHDAKSCDQLNSRKTGRREHYFPITLAAAKGQRTLYQTRKEIDSSLLKPNFGFLDRFDQSLDHQVVGEMAVPTLDLDSFMAETGMPYVDFIKLDANGNELEVLQGAQKILQARVYGIELKVFFQPCYQGQALFPELHSLLTERGFRLFGLRPENWQRGLTCARDREEGLQNGQVVFGSAIYLKDYVAMRAEGRFDYRTLDKAQLMRTITLAETLGYPDVAVELLEGLS